MNPVLGHHNGFNNYPVVKDVSCIFGIRKFVRHSLHI
jgi:hypothetical protein